MITKTRREFSSHRIWFQNVIPDNVILCGVSALEYLEMFTGYFDEKIIDVYAKEKGEYENINYNIVDNFNNINYTRYGNILCTTFEQTLNDMLLNLNDIDEMALTEALSNYYFSHNESFDGLNIYPENKSAFEYIKPLAAQYYCGG